MRGLFVDAVGKTSKMNAGEWKKFKRKKLAG